MVNIKMINSSECSLCYFKHTKLRLFFKKLNIFTQYLLYIAQIVLSFGSPQGRKIIHKDKDSFHLFGNIIIIDYLCAPSTD